MTGQPCEYSGKEMLSMQHSFPESFFGGMDEYQIESRFTEIYPRSILYLWVCDMKAEVEVPLAIPNTSVIKNKSQSLYQFSSYL